MTTSESEVQARSGRNAVDESRERYDSGTVMIAAEREDKIVITSVIEKQTRNFRLPEKVSVVRREEKYYGPELLLHAEIEGQDCNFLLTAPAPDSDLQLWVAETSEDNKRESWQRAAIVQASLASEQPPYERCDQCGELIRSIEHERRSVTGRCTRAETWN